MRKPLAAAAALFVANIATLPTHTATPFASISNGSTKTETVSNGSSMAVRAPSKTWHGYPIARIC